MSEAQLYTITNFTNTSVYALSGNTVQEALRPTLHFLSMYAYIVWYLVGFPANTIAFSVWIQRQMLNSSGCYMAALALTDNLFLLVHGLLSLGSWFDSVNILNNPVLCQALPLLYTAAQYMSALLVLEFTVEQYIAIRYPFKRSRFCRVSIARKVIIGVALLTLLLSSPQAYFFTIVEDGFGRSQCTVRGSLLVGGITSFWSVWTWTTEILLFGVTPISCLLLNVLVVQQISKQHTIKLQRHTSGGHNGLAKKVSRKTGATTVMLLAVSLYWVFTELPATITLGIKQVYDSPVVYTIAEARNNTEMEKHLNYLTARFIIEFLCFSRYSCKLLIYLATGRLFRKHLMRLLFRCNKSIQNKWNSSQVPPPSRNTATREMVRLLHRHRSSSKDLVTRQSTKREPLSLNTKL